MLLPALPSLLLPPPPELPPHLGRTAAARALKGLHSPCLRCPQAALMRQGLLLQQLWGMLQGTLCHAHRPVQRRWPEPPQAPRPQQEQQAERAAREAREAHAGLAGLACRRVGRCQSCALLQTEQEAATGWSNMCLGKVRSELWLVYCNNSKMCTQTTLRLQMQLQSTTCNRHPPGRTWPSISSLARCRSASLPNVTEPCPSRSAAESTLG